ncbi:MULTISPECIES: hypothetical protein [unclassified Microcoleus]|uniref:hypothetical protein n=1 Tax=unclassified Microcoleus TaxID=2642155 RepID=UPI001DB80269|nr:MULTISPECIES: hypothetical protein [unclassified Microcoleus]MCC3595798.1 hypothetical protein [Microcoleus sp. PH2017_26_ELK_O_A]MCC3620600.1 hypothetical protein [Microcoleus sp. PH2017_36_ELK_O_B]
MKQWSEVATYFHPTMPAKKEDPNYTILRGHVPKDLYRRFKILCLERGVDNSQGLEDLLNEYFELKGDGTGQLAPTTPTPEAPPQKPSPVSPKSQAGEGK